MLSSLQWKTFYNQMILPFREEKQNKIISMENRIISMRSLLVRERSSENIPSWLTFDFHVKLRSFHSGNDQDDHLIGINLTFMIDYDLSSVFFVLFLFVSYARDLPSIRNILLFVYHWCFIFVFSELYLSICLIEEKNKREAIVIHIL